MTEDGELAARPAPTARCAVKGPMVCQGLHRPRARPPRRSTTTGYFRTGDLGHLRADGHVVLTGRLKDIIIRKGENISAKEIEDLLYAPPEGRRRRGDRPARPRAGRAGVRGGRAARGRRGPRVRRDGRLPRRAGLTSSRRPSSSRWSTRSPQRDAHKFLRDLVPFSIATYQAGQFQPLLASDDRLLDVCVHVAAVVRRS